MNQEENNTQINDELGNISKPLLAAVSFQFLWYKNDNRENKEFVSKKTKLIDAMQDFLSKKDKKNIYDIDYEVRVDYADGSSKYISLDAKQDWDGSWYFIKKNKMISSNDIKPVSNSR